METATTSKVTETLRALASVIASRCGHGRISRRVFPNGTVRVVVTLAEPSAQHVAIARGEAFAACERAGIACQVAVS